MGLNHKPELRDCWSRDELLYNDSLPKRGEPMQLPSASKDQPVATHLKQKFLAAYIPHQQNAIDEAMAPWGFSGTECLCV